MENLIKEAYYYDETGIILWGDCNNWLNKIPDKSVDLIIADPPYFKIHGEFDFIWESVDEYIEWCKIWILECRRILKNTGSFYLWGGIGSKKGFALPKIAIWIEKNNIFNLVNWITQRNVRGYGNYKGYIQAREELLFYTKDKSYFWNPAFTDEKSTRKDLGANNKPRKNKYKRVTDVWIDIAEASQSSKQRFKLSDNSSFPTVKALKLCDRIIKASSKEGDLVYVPFAGSGSEIISCINNNRYWIATEINKQYIDGIIIPRITKNI